MSLGNIGETSLLDRKIKLLPCPNYRDREINPGAVVLVKCAVSSSLNVVSGSPDCGLPLSSSPFPAPRVAIFNSYRLPPCFYCWVAGPSRIPALRGRGNKRARPTLQVGVPNSRVAEPSRLLSSSTFRGAALSYRDRPCKAVLHLGV